MMMDNMTVQNPLKVLIDRFLLSAIVYLDI